MERASRLIGKMNVSGEIKDPEARIRAVWARVVGRNVARHTRPTNMVRGTLIVEVEDFTWQKQLASIRHFMVSNLAKELGEFIVKEIDFRPVPKRRAPQMAASSRPRSDAPGLFDEAEQIADPVMRGLFKDSRNKRQA